MMRRQPKPSWLKVRIPSGQNFSKLNNIIRTNGIKTICNEALCPNVGECAAKGVATFLVLGDKCTRNCLYCNVKSGRPNYLDLAESKRVAEAVSNLNLKYVVVTSVTRDDLDDGGACLFFDTINQIRSVSPACKIEILVPDFRGEIAPIKEVIDAQPYVFAHNIEVTEGLFGSLRPGGNFKRSLNVLRFVKKYQPCQKTKSGIMIGFGETRKQILNAMRDLRENRVDIFTICQYLQPTRDHYPVRKYYTPDEFKELEEIGYELGFSFVKSGPLVRSSYMADEIVGIT